MPATHDPGRPPLAGRTALVTGGGRGLGEAICEELAQHGAHVIVADLDGDRAVAVAQRLERQGGHAIGRRLDVRDEVSVLQVVHDAREALGDLDVIVNIASTAAKRAWPNASAYHPTKWGLLGLSHALHAELRPAGVSVSAIVAGGMRTPFLLDRFPDIDEDTLQPPEHVAAAVRFVLTQPPGTVVPEVMVLPMKETSWP
ncbi:SDR family oxidoreductase [Burkholderia sp. 22313]|uniref:SDR family oxidoreductase n=1 Tax=Burkholderia sp. 22313 TaxID=3453908 RepID=UPI003F82FE00